MNVTEKMRLSARFHRDKLAVVAGGRRLTYDEVWQRGVRMANALISLGLEPGDRVGSLEDNSLEAVDFFLGAAIANLVRVPLYARNAQASHEHMLAHTGCRAVVVSEQYAPELEGFTETIPSLEHIVVRNVDGYEEWLASHSDVDPMTRVEADDGFMIRHTAGTTGKSKGVLFTHWQWLAVGRDWFFPQPPIEVGDVCMHLAPISHASGYQFVPIFIMGGVNLVVENFTSESALDLMGTERVAYCFLAPTMVGDALQSPGLEDRDFSSLKVLLIGAAPIAVPVLKRAYDVWGDTLCQLYGQTEGAPGLITMARDWIADVPGSEPLKSLGKVHPYVDLEIRDPDTYEELPYGKQGEICMRIDGMMTGYWGGDTQGGSKLVDGWLHTNDMGYMDENGYVYLHDRKDDMIISGGFNIWPMELENVAAAHPAVLEVVVIAVANERFGQSPYMICYVNDREAVTEQELITMCADELGSYKKPIAVELRTEPLQRTPVGKISRKLIRESYLDRSF